MLNLIPGKWYKASNWKNINCAKFLKTEKDGNSWSESVYCDVYDPRLRITCTDLESNNIYTEISLSTLQQYLPKDHKDLNIELPNSSHIGRVVKWVVIDCYRDGYDKIVSINDNGMINLEKYLACSIERFERGEIIIMPEDFTLEKKEEEKYYKCIERVPSFTLGKIYKLRKESAINKMGAFFDDSNRVNGTYPENEKNFALTTKEEFDAYNKQEISKKITIKTKESLLNSSKKSLENRWLKALIDNPNCVPVKKNEYVLIKQERINDFFINIYKDNQNYWANKDYNLWELMPEDFVYKKTINNCYLNESKIKTNSSLIELMPIKKRILI